MNATKEARKMDELMLRYDVAFVLLKGDAKNELLAEYETLVDALKTFQTALDNAARKYKESKK